MHDLGYRKVAKQLIAPAKGRRGLARPHEQPKEDAVRARDQRCRELHRDIHQTALLMLLLVRIAALGRWLGKGERAWAEQLLLIRPRCGRDQPGRSTQI